MRARLAGLFVLLLTVPAIAAPITVPFEAIDNQLYVSVTVDGHGPFRFMLDTGAVDVVAQSLTVQLGLKTGAGVTVHGTGDGTAQSGIAAVPSVTVGGVTLTGENFYVLSLDPIEALAGVHVDGILGYEFFRRYVTHFDFDTRTITLTDPADFKPDGADTPMPMTSVHNTPEIAGTYDGIAGTFDIDTGDSGGLTLTTPFVATHQLRDRAGKYVDVVSGFGVGGETYARIVRGAELVLGTVPVGHPVTDLSSNTGGAFGAGAFSGNIGVDVVKRFAMTLDYVHGTLYLAPRKGAVDDIDTYDRTGMAIVPNAAGFEVYAVTKGGPAEAAGIRKGDIVIAVDGAPASGITLSAIHERQRTDPPGSTIAFTVRRDGKPMDLKVTLHDQI
jgi:hypothetical protein